MQLALEVLPSPNSPVALKAATGLLGEDAGIRPIKKPIDTVLRASSRTGSMGFIGTSHCLRIIG